MNITTTKIIDTILTTFSFIFIHLSNHYKINVKKSKIIFFIVPKKTNKVYKGEFMKKIKKGIKQNKLLLLLTILIIISIILGILFPAILSQEDKQLIQTSITDFLSAIEKGNINNFSSLISSLTNNILVTIVTWILGLSLIGIPILILIIFFKGFITGFSISSILITKGIKGTIITIIYTIPNLLNLAVTLLLGYYAISFSLVIYKSIFKKEAKNYKPIIKRYIKIGIFFLLIEILISLAEVYIIPNILRFL